MQYTTGSARGMANSRMFLVLGGFLILIIISFPALGSRRDDVAAKIQALKASLPGNNVQKRLQKSEHVWQQSVDARHKMYNAYNDPQKSLWPATDMDAYWKTPFTIWDFFPATFTCPHEMERIGRLGKGGKWICGMSRYESISLRRPCVIYSFGVAHDSSFEEQFLRRTECEIYGADSTVVKFADNIKRLTPEQKARAHFLQAKIGAKTDNMTVNPPEYSIRDLMQLNGHEYLDIVKMDLEGGEFEAMESLLGDCKGKPLPIGQLQVEIRLQAEEHVGLPYVMKWWEKLENAGLRPVWTEPNLARVTAENAAPRWAEYTFVNVRHPKNALLTE